MWFLLLPHSDRKKWINTLSTGKHTIYGLAHYPKSTIGKIKEKCFDQNLIYIWCLLYSDSVHWRFPNWHCACWKSCCSVNVILNLLNCPFYKLWNRPILRNKVFCWRCKFKYFPKFNRFRQACLNFSIHRNAEHLRPDGLVQPKSMSKDNIHTLPILKQIHLRGIFWMQASTPSPLAFGFWFSMWWQMVWFEEVLWMLIFRKTK